jgi:hypothetical protein
MLRIELLVEELDRRALVANRASLTKFCPNVDRSVLLDDPRRDVCEPCTGKPGKNGSNPFSVSGTELNVCQLSTVENRWLSVKL